MEKICNNFIGYESIIKDRIIYFSSLKDKERFAVDLNEGKISCRTISPNQALVQFDQKSKIKSEILLEIAEVIYAEK